jgi:hypothetical protein
LRGDWLSIDKALRLLIKVMGIDAVSFECRGFRWVIVAYRGGWGRDILGPFIAPFILYGFLSVKFGNAAGHRLNLSGARRIIPMITPQLFQGVDEVGIGEIGDDP